ncbi:hypothetical protein [Acinetobacter soli]|uniref:hypothetical protein n=1 Tax=Acinetobacter soli TaxID=487316 RepID=UPI0012500562|nr:hypothetical protein [Acinetobacter soli]
MKDLNLQVDQIHPDTVFVVVRGDFSSFPSIEEARSTAKSIASAFETTGVTALLLDERFTIEQLTVEQLEQLGLQRINRGTS